MTQFAKPVLILAATLALSACTPGQLSREAGNYDNGDFGNSTMQNTMVASGQIQPQMSHDKYDAPAAGRKLNGKYAAVLFKDYVASAVRTHPGNTAVTSQVTGGSGGGGGN